MIIRWFDEAGDDLEEIYQFYFTKNPGIAAKIYNAILDDAEILLTHPNIAPREPNLHHKDYVLRSLLTKDRLFKITYYVDPDIEEIAIVRVWCCRTDILHLTIKK